MVDVAGTRNGVNVGAEEEEIDDNVHNLYGIIALVYEILFGNERANVAAAREAQ